MGPRWMHPGRGVCVQQATPWMPQKPLGSTLVREVSAQEHSQLFIEQQPDLLGLMLSQKGDSQALFSPLSPSSQALAPSDTKICRHFKYLRYRPSLAPSTLTSVRDQGESIPLLSFARNSFPALISRMPRESRQALITLNEKGDPKKRETQGEEHPIIVLCPQLFSSSHLPNATGSHDQGKLSSPSMKKVIPR